MPKGMSHAHNHEDILLNQILKKLIKLGPLTCFFEMLLTRIINYKNFLSFKPEKIVFYFSSGVACHFLLQGNLLDSGAEPTSPALASILNR